MASESDAWLTQFGSALKLPSAELRSPRTRGRANSGVLLSFAQGADDLPTELRSPSLPRTPQIKRSASAVDSLEISKDKLKRRSSNVVRQAKDYVFSCEASKAVL